MDKKEQRILLLRRKARIFANSIKGTNLALKLPDEIIDWLKDSEIIQFRELLGNFGLIQRKDFYWEEKF